MSTELPEGVPVEAGTCADTPCSRLLGGRPPRCRGRRRQWPGPALAVALSAALVVGCGTSGPTTAVASGNPGGSVVPASPAPGGSIAPRTPRPAGAFTLALPTGWRSVPIGSDYAAAAARYEATSPRFASSLKGQLAGLPKSASEYAYDGSAAAVQAGTLVALTVTEVELPATVNLDAFSAEVGSQVSQVAEKTIPAERILTSSGPADRLVYEAPFGQTSGGTAVAAITQVLLVVPGRGYVLTFTTTPSRAPVDGPVFAEIARSIVLTP